MYVESVSAALGFRTGTPLSLNYPWTKAPLKGKWFVASDLSREMSGLHQSYILTGKGDVTLIEHQLGARNFCSASCLKGVVVREATVGWHAPRPLSIWPLSGERGRGAEPPNFPGNSGTDAFA